MKLVFFLIGLTIVTPASAALYEIARPGVQASHLLGLHPALGNARVERLIEPYVAGACALILLSDPYFPVSIKAIPTRLHWKAKNGPALSSRAMNTIGYLVKNDADTIDQVTRLSAGAALQYLSQQFIHERDALIDAYWHLIAEGRSPSLAVHLGPKLWQVARELYGGDLDGKVLLSMVAQRFFIEENREFGQRPGDLTLSLRAKAAGRPLIALEPEIDPAAHIERVTDADLEHWLSAVDQFLLQQDLNWFWNYLVGQWLIEELRERFLKLPVSTYAQLHGLIHAALPGSGANLPGDEVRQLIYHNRHEAWIPAIVEAVDRGGAFIAVPANHVVPGLDPLVEQTLIDGLAKRGLRVTPLPLK